VYGVVDEQGILKDGEVYINLPDRGGAQVRKVLVSRYDFNWAIFYHKVFKTAQKPIVST
jgi:hypothetical protein